MSTSTTLIWTDGACWPNPGRGGWGYVMQHHDGAVTEASSGSAQTTNNAMELTAVLEALRALPDGSVATIHSDSQYVVYGLTSWSKKWVRRGWIHKDGKPIPNTDLWKLLLDQAQRVQTTFVWVRGHAGDPGNGRADALASVGRFATLEETRA